MIFTAVWIYPIHVNFRIYVFIPLIFYFLVRFVKEARGPFLWLAAITSFVSILGSTFYYLPFYSLLILLFLLIPLIGQPSLVSKAFERTAGNFFGLLLFSGIFILYFGISLESRQSLMYLHEGRDPNSFAVPLSTFLGEGVYTDFQKFLGFVFAGPIYLARGLENHTFYLGLLPFLFVFFACLKVRNKFFWSFALVTAFLVTFSTGEKTFVAPLVYHIYPPIRFFRSIGTVGGILKPFLLVMAGYGIDAFLSLPRTKQAFRERSGNWELWWVAAALFFLVWIWAQTHRHLYHQIRWPWFGGLTAFFALLFFLASLKPGASKIYLGILILGLYAADLGIYQTLLFREFRTWTVPKALAPQTRLVRPRRCASARIPAAFISDPSSETLKIYPRYIYSYNYLDQDPCFSHFLIEYLTIPVRRLFNNRPVPTDDKPMDDWLIKTLGCFPNEKFRLSTHVEYIDNERDAEMMALVIPPEDPRDILTGVPADQRAPFPAEEPQSDPLSVTVKACRANAWEVTVNVRALAGAWLIFADAYHPKWKAYVNGRRVPIFMANLAFKAVRLPLGFHRVKFIFREGSDGLPFHLMTLLGTASGILLLAAVCRTILFGPARQRPEQNL
jgi:hypothetical protein